MPLQCFHCECVVTQLTDDWESSGGRPAESRSSRGIRDHLFLEKGILSRNEERALQVFLFFWESRILFLKTFISIAVSGNKIMELVFSLAW